MVVQCDKCSAKFRLDDAKVKEGGVKVRCSKCANIFIVKKETPVEEADYDSFLSGLMPSSPQEAATKSEYAAPAERTAMPPEGESSREPATDIPTEHGQTPDAGSPDTNDFDLSEFAFDDRAFTHEPSASAQVEQGESTGNGFDFGELDLGGTESVESSSTTSDKSAPEAPRDEYAISDTPGRTVPEFDVDIDGFDLFGASGEHEGASATSTGEATVVPANPQEFSFETESGVGTSTRETGADIFTDTAAEFSFEPGAPEAEHDAQPAGGRGGAEPPASFDFSQFDFGEEAAPGTAETGESADEDRVAEVVTGSEIERESADTPSEEFDFGAEQPPLSISTRRKGGSSLPLTVMAVCVLLVLVLGGGGFYLFKEGPAGFDKLGLGFVAKWFGAESREEGGIAVRNTTGMFLVNKEAGEIFAVTGEAVNNYDKPRASIQVKVTLFGPKGDPLAQKIAYGGNPLSRDQLVSLPPTKLEAAMNNQFGDSLSNLAVQPGKGIPFVVVLTNVPKETTEFGVEVVGSTVASP